MQRYQRVKEGLHRCIEGGRVGDDGGEVVGEVCGDDDGGHGSVPAPPEEKGRGGSFFFFFFLDLLPRWEKSFPSGPWSPWIGRGESPSEIGSISLSLSVSAFSDSALSPFIMFPAIRNSIGLKFEHDFYPNISFLAAKEGQQPPYGVSMRVRGTPCLMAPSGIVSRGFFFTKIINIPKKSPAVFIPFGLRLIWGFYEA